MAVNVINLLMGMAVAHTG